MPDAATDRDVLITAGRALGRIDLYGPRGLTLLSLDEIEAMALALVILGLVAIPPHQITPPERLIVERN
ncbi:MAG: hypothetical protein BGP11_05460 [Rhodobacterales bacterium 65-51]|uniref:hypothetical protein n=1 Tax=uncultured Gemmobacter sp. TaxID=1095917 RepID=UPI000967A59E|nr:hypothetical protein [uncultured Gemmobacter sp.]OJY33170.1 MAG: hypothetical protein BGP11_05460 [Rhodobacterales bacterium 65-51]